ncbi:GlxA family transcriptional regulator [Streptomyces sp. NPDC051561]|uniref:GlxA family transcriptional regulator n=1 Tax=Streptomyces sp. NPDC051561 TaxID=3365658 RepID=UPI003798605E
MSRAHTVIVPGLPDITAPPPADLVEAVRAAHAGGARVVSLYTGVFVLASAGLLDGRRAAAHWSYADALITRYPRVKVDPDALHADEKGILTSVGQTASLEMFLHLVRLDHGAAAAHALARRLVMPAYPAEGQAQFHASVGLEENEHLLTDLLAWISTHLDSQLSVADMAQQANVSRRTLTRYFNTVTGTTPLQWLLTQRVEQAQRLLEKSHFSVEQIAAQTGMGTAATLRRHFSRIVGIPPHAYRHYYQAHAAGASVPPRVTQVQPVV